MNINVHLCFDRCRNGVIIPQLTIGDSFTSGFCGFTFNPSNWNKPIEIPLTAVTDGIIDTRQQINIKVTAQLIEDGKPVLERQIVSYPVCIV